MRSQSSTLIGSVAFVVGELLIGLKVLQCLKVSEV